MCSCQSFDGSFSRGAKDNSVYHSVGANDIISSVWSCQSVTFRIWFPLSEKKKKKNESFFLFLHLLSIFLQLFRDIQTSLRNLEVSSRGLLSIPHTQKKNAVMGKNERLFTEVWKHVPHQSRLEVLGDFAFTLCSAICLSERRGRPKCNPTICFSARHNFVISSSSGVSVPLQYLRLNRPFFLSLTPFPYTQSIEESWSDIKPRSPYERQDDRIVQSIYCKHAPGA